MCSDRGAADACAARHLQHRQPLGRQQDDVRSLHMLERPVPVAEDRGQARAILRSDNDADSLGHATSIRTQQPVVNPLSASVH
jgi:hypothetical protein